jgi:glycosyltransferase involved in cell wall biosynthesis
MANKKTILLNASDAGSLINFRGPLIKSLVSAGHKVHVTAPDISTEINGLLREFGAEVHRVDLARTGTNPVSDIRYVVQLYSILRDIGADRVISYTIKPNIWGSFAARLAGVKSASMVTGLGLSFIPGTGLKRRLLQSVMQSLYRLATACNDRVVFQNPDDLKDFIVAGCLGAPDKAVLVNGSGVDLNHYSRVPLPPQPVFLMISRLIVSKGVREFATAAMELIKSRKDCRFVIAGFIDNGPDAISQRELDTWIKAGIEFVGPLKDVRPIIAEASVYVLPSYREGTPRSVLEAMAMGRPIITTDAPGCRETVVDGVNGILVPVGRSEAVANAMVRLADDNELRAEFGEASHRYASKKYNVDTVNRSLCYHLALEI